MGVSVIGNLHKRYTSPTPKVWLAVGDAALILGSTMTATFAGLDMGKWWVIASVLFTAAGKIIPGFVTAIQKEEQDQ